MKRTVNSKIAASCAFLALLTITAIPAETKTPAAPPPVKADTNESRAMGKLEARDIENNLIIGKSPNDNLSLKPINQYEQGQDAQALKRLESIKRLRGGTNQWEEVPRLLQEILATDASRAIKQDVKRMALLE